MADLAIPSAAKLSTIDAGAQPKDNKAAAPAKPERPDEEKYKAELAKAEKEWRAAEEKFKSIRSKLDLAQPNNKELPTSKRQQELRAELQQIRTQQQSSKSSRGQILDQIKRKDDRLKEQINKQKTERSKSQFKSVDDIQNEIDRLQKQVDSGNMRIVDEKKALADISQLNRQKKSFGTLDDAQKGIDQLKAEIAELRKTLDDPESKALSERYTQIQAELDKIKAEQDDVYKNLKTLRDERTKALDDQQKKYLNVKEIKDKYYQANRAARDYEREARRIRDEKRRAENEAYHRGRRQEAAKAKLEDASAPAFEVELRVARSLLAHFDPSSVAKQEASGPGKYAATASRTIDASGIKGTALKKKGDEEENYFVGAGGKKKNQRNRGQASGTSSPAPESKFNLDIGTIDSFGRLGIDPPMSQAGVPTVVEKLKEKIDFWKSDQDRKTKENIAKAQAEIEKLETEAQEADSKQGERSTETGRKPAAEKQQVNGSASASAQQQQEKDAVADAAEDLEKAKIEDATAPEGGA
ncbi:hypothetical protein EJ03DRAFT_387690 [Teratosphaeria nubilosa]|uniref:Nuclear segregation protein n=1 Tax=Teratosphaeria nubilosa TaxID=161662 RepID=A0A6G1LJR5_9PEZI|nr:hypothetical protein EJ03DRAFT_387690 [Teratosphaeria nubilosa]